MTRLHRFAPHVTFTSLALLIAGCGGGPPKPARRPPAPSATTASTGGTSSSSSGASESKSKKAIDPSTLGTIEVTVKFEGDEKKNRKIKMGSDPFCGAAHSDDVRQEKFVRNDNKTMANAVVHLSQGWDMWEVEDAKETVLMDQVGCVYVPHVSSVQTKQEIEFKNSDQTLHNVHPKPDKNKEMNQATPANSSIKHSFRRPELGISVKCDVHPWMLSYISVFKHPWHAVTPKGDGKATLASVPAGEYKIQAWHEALGESKEVSVKVEAGKTATIELAY